MTDDLLTSEEFMKKLKIGRSTLFEWLRSGVLEPGRHYVKVGRVLRFIWSNDIVAALAEATVQRKRQPERQRGSTAKPGINWEY